MCGAARVHFAAHAGGGLATALHPLQAPPQGPAWNLAELADVLPAQALVPAAVLIGVVARPAGSTVLLTRRTEGLSNHGGQVSFPGGRIEVADGGPLRAALREAQEEIAIAPELVTPLGFLDPYATISGFHVLPVVARLDVGVQLRPDPTEVAEVFEVPLAFLLDPANCERCNVEFRGRMRHYFQFRHGGHLIWGATAAMLVNLRQRLTGGACLS